PGAADAGHPRLAAKLALGTHLAGDSGDLRGERRELIDHRVDRGLQLKDLAGGVNVDLLGQVAAGHRRGDLRDIAHLAGEVVGHALHVVRPILPGAADAGDPGLAAKPALGTYFARHTRDLVRERRELIDHRVDGLLQLEDLAAGVDGDLLRQVAAGHRRG